MIEDDVDAEGRGMVKSLKGLGYGPVVLVLTQKVGIKSKKPLWFVVCDGLGRG
jgi:hypothetical protein